MGYEKSPYRELGISSRARPRQRRGKQKTIELPNHHDLKKIKDSDGKRRHCKYDNCSRLRSKGFNFCGFHGMAINRWKSSRISYRVLSK